MVMTMVMNMNMNMVLPAVGRNLNNNFSRKDQGIGNILYLLCSIGNDDNPDNIFVERMKYFPTLP